MKKATFSSISYGFLGAAIFTAVVHAGPAIAQVAKNLVQLQPNTPGTTQIGNVNVSGRVIAGQIQGDGSSLTNLNAGSLAAGTVADSRLSSNVMTVGASQSVTGVKTFNASPSFPNTTVPFTVASPSKVINLNADLLDSLSSASFLQSTPPITVSGSNASPIFKVSQTMNGSVGLRGESTSAGTGVFASSTGAGGIALHAAGTTQAWAAKFEGDVIMEHNQDYLMKDYTGGGSYSCCIPIAYGIVNSDGTIRTGTGNFTIFKLAPAVARISIDGIGNVSGLVTNVTPVGTAGSNPRFCFVNVDPTFNAIEVTTFDINGVQAATNFTFVAYKLIP